MTYYGKITSLRREGEPLATTIGDYALFAIGKTVDTYNSSLVKGNAPDLQHAHGSDGAVTTVGDYALFGGGYVNSHGVDACNSSLVLSAAPDF